MTTVASAVRAHPDRVASVPHPVISCQAATKLDRATPRVWAWMRATQIAAVEHRALVYMSAQAACVAGLLFMLDQREPARPAAPAAGRGSPRNAGRPAMLSGDGVHAAWECDWGSTSLCLLDGSRVIRHPRGSDRLLGFHRDAAVVLRRLRDRPALVLIEAATGAERRPLALPQAPAGAELADAWRMTADDAAVIATARAPATTGEATGESWLVRVALPHGAVTTARLPRAAIRVGFATAGRGVAAGEDAATLWLTTDGGAHWQARHAVSGVNRTIACSADRCVVDDLVVVSFDRPIARAADRVITAPVQAAAPPAPSRGPGLACKADDTAQPAPDRDQLCRGDLDARGRLRFQNPNVDVALAVAADGR